MCVCGYGGGCDRVLTEFVVTLLAKNSPFHCHACLGRNLGPKDRGLLR